MTETLHWNDQQVEGRQCHLIPEFGRSPFNRADQLKRGLCVCVLKKKRSE